MATALLAGCTKSTVTVVPPTPAPAVAEACAHLNNLLPQRLGGLRPRVISPRSPLVHAWGSPAIVLTCGVAQPAGYSPTSSETTAVDGVRWFEQPGADPVIWTALRPTGIDGSPVNVRLAVPQSYSAQGGFLVDLAVPLKEALP